MPEGLTEEVPSEEEKEEELGDWFGNNRVLCTVLEEMRTLDKSKNYSYLNGLIEEAQSMGNRMEAALSDQKDLIKLQGKVSKLKKELKLLRQEKKELKSK